MRLQALTTLGFALLTGGCFSDPPVVSGSGSSSTDPGDQSGRTSSSAGSSGDPSGETSADGGTSGLAESTGTGSSGTGIFGAAIYLYDETCGLGTDWQTTTQTSACVEDDAEPGLGAYVQRHMRYDNGGASLTYVLEVRPPPIPSEFIRGRYEELDTTGFLMPSFRTQLECPVDSSSCAATVEVASAADGDMQEQVFDMLTEPVQLDIPLPVDPSLTLSITVRAQAGLGQGIQPRVLIVDPRIEDAAL